jgi:uncharacterized protein
MDTLSSPSTGQPAATTSKPGRTSLHARHAAFGLALGFVVTNIGFADFGELNAMFTLRDLRMLFTFGFAVGLVAFAFRVLGIERRPPRTAFHKGIVPGGVLFGIGWALSGGCPAISLTQLSSGYLPAIATIGGIIIGMTLFRVVNQRWMRIDRGSCSL